MAGTRGLRTGMNISEFFGVTEVATGQKDFPCRGDASIRGETARWSAPRPGIKVLWRGVFVLGRRESNVLRGLWNDVTRRECRRTGTASWFGESRIGVKGHKAR